MPGDRRAAAQAEAPRPGREHRHEERVGEAEVAGAARVAPGRQVEAQRVDAVGAAVEQPRGRAAGDRPGRRSPATNSGTATAIDGRRQPAREQQPDGARQQRLDDVGARADAAEPSVFSAPTSSPAPSTISSGPISVS